MWVVLFPTGGLGVNVTQHVDLEFKLVKDQYCEPSLYCVSTFLALFWPTNKLQPDAQNLWMINGHFPTISSQLFAKYMNVFHKIEVQTIILRYWTGLKLNWNKTYVFPFSIFFYFILWKIVICVIFFTCFALFAFFCICALTFEPIKF